MTIEVRSLTKRYGRRTAVDDISFEVPAGEVTGFLGPNGAGKSTTMRMIVGLDRPMSGEALIDGRRYAALRLPLRRVGALLGDPDTLILDEPVNGLDPDGVTWMRELLRSLAAEGRTVFLSSHLLAELALVATRVIVIGRGRILADTPVDALTTTADGGARSPCSRRASGTCSKRSRSGGRTARSAPTSISPPRRSRRTSTGSSRSSPSATGCRR